MVRDSTSSALISQPDTHALSVMSGTSLQIQLETHTHTHTHTHTLSVVFGTSLQMNGGEFRSLGGNYTITVGATNHLWL